jgi:hypothetical protein
MLLALVLLKSKVKAKNSGCHYGSLFLSRQENIVTTDKELVVEGLGFYFHTAIYSNPRIHTSVPILFQLDFFHRLTLNQHGLVIGVGGQILFALQFLDDPIRCITAHLLLGVG